MSPSTSALMSIVSGHAPKVRIADIGAMHIEGAPASYESLVDAGLAEVVGFEAVREECERLNAAARPGRTYLPYFVGDGSEGTFRVNSAPMTSSFFETNVEVCSRFENLENLMRVVRSERVRTTRLDDVQGLGDIDFVKMDIQGSELGAIRGGPRLFSRVTVVETEVCFVDMYRGQPLFADIDAELRRQGFIFHTFQYLAGRPYSPMVVDENPNQHVRQLLWGDAVYVRDPGRFPSTDPDKLVRLAVVLHEVHQSYDLAALALHHYDRQRGTSLWQAYFRMLASTPIPQPPRADLMLPHRGPQV